MWSNGLRVDEDNRVEQENIDGLLDELNSADIENDRLSEIARLLCIAQDRRGIEPIVRRLRSANDWYEVRADLVLALGCLGAIESAPYLFELFNSPTEHVSVKARLIFSLGHLGYREVTDRLIAIVDQSDSPLLIWPAVQALGYLGDEKAIDCLTKALESKLEGIPQAAAQSLARFGPKALGSLYALEKLAASADTVEAISAAEAIAAIRSNTSSIA
jgi:HEAT repeat protein